ncbi:hypothetical protein SBA7_1630002 [Candidatus Sulfotelmatobacter sp. SbA7]|nr:hypothetical protein SBA7_1630002 [Candidatus Sulfotelmatobacter sp. SbA7]
MVNLKRKNHFLPVCYQKGFADVSGKVWVKFADKPKPEQRNPLSVGRKQSLYIVKRNGKENDKVENFFNDVVEAPFAPLSLRIRKEQNQFANLTGEEWAALCGFVALQAVRTPAHKRCLEEQAGSPLDTNAFVTAIARQALAIMEEWNKSLRRLHFYTSLPHVGEQFISGDSPVVLTQMNDNRIWVPTSTPELRTTDLAQVLSNPNHEFWLPLSPYVCVSVRGHVWGEPHLPPQTVDPQFVRFLNGRVREQSGIFLLARDKASLS